MLSGVDFGTAEHLGRQPCEVRVDVPDGNEIGRSAEDLPPRPVRRRALRLNSDTPQGRHMALPSQRHQLLGQPRLAYPRLPSTQHDAGMPLLGGHQTIGERSQLPVTSNKGTAHPLDNIRLLCRPVSRNTAQRIRLTKSAGSV